ncbi:kunitz-type serine protease inhibitor HCRG2-like [Drosophila persimilis]|uniref:kunitz-type serine protease inhibitor HCRG2-like n=1 Tax=Drosophila persimilis TaxID=7234 RepID=UPI000F088C49|nr:kunitz-type serine protease inhibitor HCRG2-like [Drosophila persimilis]
MKDNKFNKAVCLQEPSYGECKGRRSLWYYNSFTNKCEMFIYSNCGGNGNRFLTYKNCERLCRIPKWHSSMFVTE